MTSGSNPKSDAEQRVLEMAATDEHFRSHLLQDPKGALREHMDMPLPDSINVRVIEEGPGEVVLVLPSQSRAAGSTLSDSELETVAGGGANSWVGDQC